jgi:hypothetical protein
MAALCTTIAFDPCGENPVWSYHPISATISSHGMATQKDTICFK